MKYGKEMPKIHIKDLLYIYYGKAKYYNSSVINGLEIFCLNSNLYSN